MPLGKYYCDYCDKHIQDTPTARKRHLQGIQHLRSKALWYDSFKFQDPSQVYPDGFVKGFVIASSKRVFASTVILASMLIQET
ncbi:hypothetical protein K1719_046645 [Acacia pycnantha]|nr:hypothetical protein K1719_046645 [Acacia pycnantha]